MLFEPGDIAACYGTDATSRVISLATCSVFPPLFVGPSHVALIVRDKAVHSRELGKPFWFESTTLCRHACLHAKALVNGPQIHHPENRINDYVAAGGRVDLYRLSNLDALEPFEQIHMARIVEKILHEIPSYDMAGAILSGTRCFHWSKLFPSADFESLFCSELVAKVLQKLGLMNQGNPTRLNPARMMRRLLRSGVYRFHRSFDQHPPRVSA